jgi:hypothetical protein
VVQRIVEITVTIEPNQAVHARPRQEKEIVRVSRLVEGVSYRVVSLVPLVLQTLPALLIFGGGFIRVIPDANPQANQFINNVTGDTGWAWAKRQHRTAAYKRFAVTGGAGK